MKVLRTPEERFSNISDFPVHPHFLDIEDNELGSLRIAYIDEGPRDGSVILCMHGEPSWSYLYRKMIPVFVAVGFRVIAPDLIGFGRSDKPVERTAYSYSSHVRWMSDWIQTLGIQNITLVAQDWGGLIGLRLVAAMPDLFDRVSISNTGLPTGDYPVSDAFMEWREFSQSVEEFDTGFIVNMFDQGTLSEEEKDAYRAPFPSEEYLAGARQFPLLVPISPDDPASEDNRKAWDVLQQWDKPFLLCFSDADPITAPWQKSFHNVPGTKNQPHITLSGLHFIQEQDGERWADSVIEWINH